MSERQQKLAEAARKKQVDQAEATRRANLAATQKSQKIAADKKAIADSQKREKKDIVQRRGKKDVSKIIEEKKVEKELGHKETAASLEKEKLALERDVIAVKVGSKPIRGGKPDYNISDVANRLYKEANLTIDQSKRTGKTKIPTVKEAKARLSLAIIEIIIGGSIEGLYGTGGGKSLSDAAKNRSKTAQLRFIGALATPTAADMVAGYTLAKLGATKIGKAVTTKLYHQKLKLLNVIDPLPVAAEENGLMLLHKFSDKTSRSIPTKEYFEAQKALKTITPDMLDDLVDYGVVTADDIKLFEQFVGNKGYSTSDMRNALPAIKKIVSVSDPGLTVDESKFVESFVGKYGVTTKELRELPADVLQNVARRYGDPTLRSKYTAGASLIPEDLYIFQELAYDLNMDSGELINFLKKNNNHFASGSIIAAIIPSLSKKDTKNLLEETTDLPKTEIKNIIEQLRKAAPRDKINITTIPDTDTKPDEIIDTKPDEIIDTKPDEIIDTKPDEATIQEPLEEPITEEEPIQEEEPIETPLIKLSLKDKKKRKELNLSLFRGKKRIYEATYYHKAGRTETIGPIQARSLFDATQKAQRARRSSKQIPRKGSIRLIGETKK